MGWVVGAVVLVAVYAAPVVTWAWESERVRRAIRQWAEWFRTPSYRWTVGLGVAVIGLTLIGLGFAAQEEVISRQEIVTRAGQTSWAFWIVGTLLTVAGVLILVLPPFLLRERPKQESSLTTVPIVPRAWEPSRNRPPPLDTSVPRDKPTDQVTVTLKHLESDGYALRGEARAAAASGQPTEDFLLRLTEWEGKARQALASMPDHLVRFNTPAAADTNQPWSDQYWHPHQIEHKVVTLQGIRQALDHARSD